MGRVDKPQLTEGRQNRGGAEPTAPTERRMAQQTVLPDHGILAALVSTQNTQRCVPLRFHAGRTRWQGLLSCHLQPVPTNRSGRLPHLDN